MLALVLSVAFAATSEMDRARLEMNAAAANMVNVETTRTPEGGPYKYRRVECAAEVCKIVEELRVRTAHIPEHADADTSGNVRFPLIDVEYEKRQIRAAIAKYDRLSTKR